MSLFNMTLTQNRNMYITKLQQRNSAFSFIAVLHLENCSEIFNTEKSYFIVCIYYNKEGNIIMNTVYSFLPAEHSMIRETNHLRCKMIDDWMVSFQSWCLFSWRQHGNVFLHLPAVDNNFQLLKSFCSCKITLHLVTQWLNNTYFSHGMVVHVQLFVSCPWLLNKNITLRIMLATSRDGN